MRTSPAILISTVQYHEELTTDRVTSTEVVEAARRLGADGVEFRDAYWRDKDREIPALRRLTGDLGLIATYATSATLFTADPTGRAALLRDIDDAVALGSSLLRVFQGQASDDDHAGWDDARRAVDYAASRGIVLALENFARAPGCRLAEIERVLGRIAAPALGTNVDIGNYALNGEDLPAVVRALGERIVSSHLKDNAGAEATYLGGGTLPLREVLTEFDRLPRMILHCFEFEGGGDPEGRIARSLAYLRER